MTGLTDISSQDGVEGMLRPRSYQQEMLQESLKQNIIVAMDTGSGKTQMYDNTSAITSEPLIRPVLKLDCPRRSVT